MFSFTVTMLLCISNHTVLWGKENNLVEQKPRKMAVSILLKLSFAFGTILKYSCFSHFLCHWGLFIFIFGLLLSGSTMCRDEGVGSLGLPAPHLFICPSACYFHVLCTAFCDLFFLLGSPRSKLWPANFQDGAHFNFHQVWLVVPQATHACTPDAAMIYKIHCHAVALALGYGRCVWVSHGRGISRFYIIGTGSSR